MPRLVPVVTLINAQAVKTTNFKNPRYVGDPTNTVALLSSYEAEELIVLDISRNFGEKPTDSRILSQIVENAFMPIAYGGGIQSLEDSKTIFSLGFDKVVLKTNLFKDGLVEEIANNYGAQAVTACLDVNYSNEDDGWVELNGIRCTIEEGQEAISKLSELGVGELIVQDIQREGTRGGLRNHVLLQYAISSLKIPVIPLGGCRDIYEAAKFLVESKCHSVAASTMFLFRPTRDAILVTYPNIDQWHQSLERS